MNYSLAKQLKDAGFPQDNISDFYSVDWEGNSYKTSVENMVSGGVSENDIKIPTLSELIEACGDDLTILENWGDGWSAYEEQMDLVGIETKGKTPEIAVANLWLELHK